MCSLQNMYRADNSKIILNDPGCTKLWKKQWVQGPNHCCILFKNGTVCGWQNLEECWRRSSFTFSVGNSGNQPSYMAICHCMHYVKCFGPNIATYSVRWAGACTLFQLQYLCSYCRSSSFVLHFPALDKCAWNLFVIADQQWQHLQPNAPNANAGQPIPNRIWIWLNFFK